MYMFKTHDNLSHVLCLTAERPDEQSFLFLELFVLARHFLFLCVERLISLLLLRFVLFFRATQFDVNATHYFAQMCDVAVGRVQLNKNQGCFIQTHKH